MKSKINAVRSTNDESRFGLASCACAAAIAACTLLAGCDRAPAKVDGADYSATLNRYYEGRPVCLWTNSVTFPVEFPAQAAVPSQPDQRGLDALVDTGLLTRTRGSDGSSQASYDLTKEGYSALDRDIDDPSTGNFCYGRRKVVSIDADRRHSTTTELVDFHYSVPHPASWAMEVSIQRAFPQVVSELSGSHQAQAVLLDTNKGWEVSTASAAVAPAIAAPHSPLLARARALLQFNKEQPS